MINKRIILQTLLACAAALFLSACGPTETTSNDHDHEHGDGHDHDHDHGTEAVETEPVAAMETSDSAVIEAQLAGYPLEECVVSGEPLDSMGGPLDYVHEGKLVRVCCKDCIPEFKKDPTAYLTKIEAARE